MAVSNIGCVSTRELIYNNPLSSVNKVMLRYLVTVRKFILYLWQ